MEKEIVINFKPDGSADAMHFDGFNLAFLGDRDVTRASELIFNPETQRWDIHLVTHHKSKSGKRTTSVTHDPVPEAQGFSSYEECRSIEVRWLQACRVECVEPTSKRGIRMLVGAKYSPELSAAELASISRAVRN